MKIELVEVTPEMATEWLSHNKVNRPVRRPVVASYARDMKNEEWTLNAETIKFSKNGDLIDGQHRLTGLVMSGKTVKMVVASGLPDDAQNTVDAGAKRKFSDILHWQSEKHATILAAISRRALMWDKGIRQNVGKFTPTYSEMLDYLDDNPSLRDSTIIAESLRHTAGIPASILGLGHFLFARVAGEEDAGWFLARVADGVGLPAYHPVLAFRERMRKERMGGGRIHESAMLALLIFAWNAYRKGENRYRLQLPKGGLTTENFPMPI